LCGALGARKILLADPLVHAGMMVLAGEQFAELLECICFDALR
jgi:hypothetical protein